MIMITTPAAEKCFQSRRTRRPMAQTIPHQSDTASIGAEVWRFGRKPWKNSAILPLFIVFRPQCFRNGNVDARNVARIVARRILGPPKKYAGFWKTGYTKG
jgi:hypothetical protein